MTDSRLPLGPREAAILQALENGCTRRAAAGAAGISHTTLYTMLREDLPFRAAVERAENVAEARATSLVLKTAYEGTWTAAAWWLERRRPDDYGKRIAVDVSIRDEVTRLAAELGIDVDEALAEAERVLAESR